MSNLTESDIMEKLTRVDELLTKSYLNQNLHESLNILQIILCNLDTSLINFKKQIIEQENVYYFY